MKIVVGSDPFGFLLKEIAKKHLFEKAHEVEDLGTFNLNEKTPYFTIARNAAEKVRTGAAERAILVCSTGLGMAMIANKHSGIYAAACENAFSAKQARSIYNANVLGLGGHLTTPIVAKEIIDTWLGTEFTEGWNSANQHWLQYAFETIQRLEKEQLFPTPTVV